MNCPFNEEQLNQLKTFVDFCKAEPQIIHHPKLAFFKEYLSALGVTIPGPMPSAKTFTPSGDTNTSKSNADDTTPTSSGEETTEDSDVELNMDEYFRSLELQDPGSWY